ncbi:MAG: hypothetical protein EOO73_34865 [Myxococcales bacterium]|nr:MAG: hypothetical protein EOO73_34865 [Myxococcales bacterium]
MVQSRRILAPIGVSTEPGDFQRAAQVGNEAISSMAFSHDGRLLAIGSDDGSVRVRNNASTELSTLDAYQRSISKVSFDASDSYLVVSSFDGRTTIWPLTLPNDVLQEELGSPVQQAELDGNETKLIMSNQRCAALWDLSTNTRIGVPLCFHDRQVVAVGFVNDVPSAVFQGSDLTRWSLTTQEKVATFDDAPDTILAAKMTPDGRLLAVGQGTTRFWPAAGDTPTFAKDVGGFPAALSADGQAFAFASQVPERENQHRVQIWGLTGKSESPSWVSAPLSTLPATLALSRDAQAAALGGLDGSVVVWPTRTASLRAMPTPHADAVLSLRFSSDAASVVSASRDATARVWNIADAQDAPVIQDDKPIGRRLRPDGTLLNELGLAPSSNGLTFATFSADARRVLTVSQTGAVQAHYSVVDGLLFQARCVRDRGRRAEACETSSSVWPRTRRGNSSQRTALATDLTKAEAKEK